MAGLETRLADHSESVEHAHGQAAGKGIAIFAHIGNIYIYILYLFIRNVIFICMHMYICIYVYIYEHIYIYLYYIEGMYLFR